MKTLLTATSALFLLASGCSTEVAAPPPVPSPSSPTSAAAPPSPSRDAGDRRRPIDLPDVTGQPLPSTVRTLQRALVPPYWKFEVGRRPCAATPVVVDQRPAAGPIRHGVAVLLQVEVGRCQLDDDLRAAADAYVAFARGGQPPPTSDPVALLVGHEVVALLNRTTVADRDAWRGCPSSGFYAAALCPFEFLRPFGEGPVEIGTAPPAHPCQVDGRLPPRGLGTLRSVTVTHPGSCVDHAAARLYVDVLGRIVAVDLTFPEP